MFSCSNVILIYLTKGYYEPLVKFSPKYNYEMLKI